MTDRKPTSTDFPPASPPILGDEELQDLTKQADQAANAFFEAAGTHARAILEDDEKKIAETYGPVFEAAYRLSLLRGLLKANEHPNMFLVEKAADAWENLVEPAGFGS